VVAEQKLLRLLSETRLIIKHKHYVYIVGYSRLRLILYDSLLAGRATSFRPSTVVAGVQAANIESSIV